MFPTRPSALCFRAALPLVLLSAPAIAQSSSGILRGSVKDATGAIIPNATITLNNTVSGYQRVTTSDENGEFQFFNVPFNPYRLVVSSTGFASANRSLQVSSNLPQVLPVVLNVAAAGTVVEVEAAPDLLENDPSAHTDIDRSTIANLPVEQASSALSSIVTALSPGVAADSNGLLHGLGDHNEVSFSIDGQPITDQQSKVFSNQVPAAAIQSLEVIEGAPPAEYGDKTSLVIVGTTRSGQGMKVPTGDIELSYGSFGTSDLAVNVGYGGKHWGNFLAVDGLQSGRFLDAPEFRVYNDKGNEFNFFDRVDFQFNDKDSIHNNFQYTRSWFQTPNSYDTQFFYRQSGLTAGATDQRSKIETVNISPTYTRVLSDKSVLNFAPFLRRDGYHYYPSKDLLNDFGPLQQEAAAQDRSLLNVGVHGDISYVSGRHTFKLGGRYSQTFLREKDRLGLVDAGLNDPASANYNSILAPYDLTRGGQLYTYTGRTDVKQLALYGQDQITAGGFIVNLGVRGDFYNGLSIQRQVEPRVGLSYSIKHTGTVLRASYARTQETPFNENLVLASQGCLNPVVQAIFLTLGSCDPAPFNAGFRNEFHAGVQQSIGRHFIINGDYLWKYTHNAYDFSVLGATPITFPIAWHNSKIPGFTIAATLTPVHGFSARVTMSSVAARFFNPQIGGVGATVSSPGGYPFRIDHDERFNQTTHLEYRLPFHKKPIIYSFNWRYDSGLVAGATPCYNVTDPNSSCADFSFDANGNPLTVNGRPAVSLASLTADEQFQSGLACNGVKATPTQGFSVCQASLLTSSLLSIPAAGTGTDDRNPGRIAPRNVFDMMLGDEDVFHFHKDRYKVGMSVTAINVANKVALYNFLSTFSGTHYLTPRALTGEIALHF